MPAKGRLFIAISVLLAVLLFFLIVTVRISFAALFLASREVRHLLRDVQELNHVKFFDVLNDPQEALYFRMVTITTLATATLPLRGAWWRAGSFSGNWRLGC